MLFRSRTTLMRLPLAGQSPAMQETYKIPVELWRDRNLLAILIEFVKLLPLFIIFMISRNKTSSRITSFDFKVTLVKKIIKGIISSVRNRINSRIALPFSATSDFDPRIRPFFINREKFTICLQLLSCGRRE